MPTVEVPFVVEQNYDGWRLDRYLQQKISRLSRARIQKIIRASLRSDGKTLKPSSTVTSGMKFVLLKETDDEKEPVLSGPMAVLHSDDQLLILDKPAGLAVHPSARYWKHTVTQWLTDNATDEGEKRPDLAHRLDRETSGVLVCGKGIVATRALKLAFRQRKIEKSYLALTMGRVERDEFTIDLAMRLTEDIRVVMEIHADGLASATEVRVLKRGVLKSDGHGVSLVECRPQTGRQHQIRVHLQAIGNPIIGDKIYNGDVGRFLRFCKNEQTEEDRVALRLNRHALHAWKIALPHPATGVEQGFSAPLALDLQRFADEQIEWREILADV